MTFQRETSYLSGQESNWLVYEDELFMVRNDGNIFRVLTFDSKKQIVTAVVLTEDGDESKRDYEFHAKKVHILTSEEILLHKISMALQQLIYAVTPIHTVMDDFPSTHDQVHRVPEMEVDQSAN